MIKTKNIQLIHFIFLFCNAINHKAFIKLHQNASAELSSVNKLDFIKGDSDRNTPAYIEYQEPITSKTPEELILESQLRNSMEKINNMQLNDGNERIESLMAELLEIDNIDRQTGLIGDNQETDSDDYSKTQLERIKSQNSVESQNAAFKLRDFNVIDDPNSDHSFEEENPKHKSDLFDMIVKLVSRIKFLIKAYNHQKLSTAINLEKNNPFDELKSMYEVFSATSADKVLEYKEKANKDINEFDTSVIDPDDIIANLDTEEINQTGEFKQAKKDFKEISHHNKDKSFISMATKYSNTKIIQNFNNNQTYTEADKLSQDNKNNSFNFYNTTDNKGGISYAKLLKFLVEIDQHSSVLVKHLGLKPKPIFKTNKLKFKKQYHFKKSKSNN